MPLMLPNHPQEFGDPIWQLTAEWAIVRPSPTNGLATREMLDRFLKTTVRAGVPLPYASRILEGIQLTLVNLSLIYFEKNIRLKVLVRLFLKSDLATENSGKGWGHFLVEHIENPNNEKDFESFNLVDVFVFPEG